MTIVVTTAFVTTPIFSSLFLRGSKLHGVESKIAGSKHNETPTLPFGVEVGLATVVVTTVIGLEATGMETTLVVVD